MRYLAIATWGLKPIILKEIYQIVIKKMILGGAQFWYKGFAKQIQKLNSIQTIPLLMITKCYSTVSTDALCVLAGVLPIKHLIEKEIEHLNLVNEQSILKNVFNIKFKEHNYRMPMFNLEFAVKRCKNVGGGFEVYTDDSKMNNRVGCAYVVCKNGNEIYNCK